MEREQNLSNVVPSGAVCPPSMLSPDMQALGRSAIATEQQFWETTSPLELRDQMGITVGSQVVILPLRLANQLWHDMWKLANDNNTQYLTQKMQASMDSRHFYLLFVCFPELRNLVSLARQRTNSASILAAEQGEAARQRQVDVEFNKPENVLLRAYQEYIVVKKCYDDRKGYLSVNISDEEIEKARQAARGIEQKLIEADSALDKDALWKKANNNQSPGGEGDRDSCQATFHDLLAEYAKLVPEAKGVRKDF